MGIRKKVLAQALLVMLLWGSLFPMIKLGYRFFAIDTSYVPNLLLFAGVRFLLSGLCIAVLVRARHESFAVSGVRAKCLVLAVAAFAIVLHYGFTYTGLATTASSITALLKQIGAILFICFSFLVVREDRFEMRKLIAAALGLLGIVALNGGELSPKAGLGELLIIAASFCTVFSGVFSQKAMKCHVAPLTLTCYSQTIGGAVLTAAGLLGGGHIGAVTLPAVLVFCYICAASIAGYCLWNRILQKNDLAYMLIIKFFEPLFAALCGALLLGENVWNLPFLLAAALTLASLLVICVRRDTP